MGGLVLTFICVTRLEIVNPDPIRSCDKPTLEGYALAVLSRRGVSPRQVPRHQPVGALDTRWFRWCADAGEQHQRQRSKSETRAHSTLLMGSGADKRARERRPEYRGVGSALISDRSAACTA